MTAPIVDWQSESPDRVPVRVVICDDADFFESPCDRDRQGFFQVIANSLIQMLNRQARLQFGFPVSVIHGPQAGTECYVEYYITMIRTDFQDGPAARSRYAATVSAGRPPKKLRMRRAASDD